MKNLIILVLIVLYSEVFATDRFVNPNLSQGNGSTIFTTITAAVAAAENGDRIIVASSTYNEADLSIGKTIQIIPKDKGKTIKFNNNIIINGFGGMKLDIVGLDLGSYSFRFNNVEKASHDNLAIVNIINCSSLYILAHKPFYKTNILNNDIEKGIAFVHGSVVYNRTKQISLLDGPLENQVNDKRNIIIANEVEFLIGIMNNDLPVIVANNKLRDFSMKRWNANLELVNYVMNNEFTSTESVLSFSKQNVPAYNIIFSSNEFNDRFWMADFHSGFVNDLVSESTWDSQNYSKGLNGIDMTYGGVQILKIFNYNNWLPSWNWPYVRNKWYATNGPNEPTRPENKAGSGFYYRWVTNGSTIDNKILNYYSTGFFEFSYNGIEAGFNIPPPDSKLRFTNIKGEIGIIDGGHPNHQFYDIDLTRNDRGVYGGGFTLENYIAINDSDSGNFIFYLEIPSDLFPGDNVKIKATSFKNN